MCPEMTTLLCSWSELEELNAAGLAALEHLDARQSALKELDITGCTALNVLYCNDTMLTELDTSTCPELYFDHIRAEGGGYIGSSGGGMYGWMTAIAKPSAGSEFLGWFSESGELISSELSLSENQTAERSIVARFTEPQPIPGDVNGSGAVDVADAVIVMRASMGLIELTEQQFAAGDINGDGQINITDAVTLLRMAMGIA